MNLTNPISDSKSRNKQILTVRALDRIEAFVSIFVTFLPHELSALLYSSSTFFFASIDSIAPS
ncbi:hypothetical protein H5410_031598 [Solanum commersonii]|uniref:Uncharacterized protein n=1 Tax=Solanum commersonii TaxID=4109 RepID=A0A9J5YM71_SOLCO|nr:hypothetical protein H5410_031598 [Solanum commersonii]